MTPKNDDSKKKGIIESGDSKNGDYLHGKCNGGDVDNDDGTNGKLCCLMALKFSAGNMRKPNLWKFSKAFKEIIRRFHTFAKHAKKLYY